MSRAHKILANFANGCAWFLDKGAFSYSCRHPHAQLVNLYLSVICTDFLHLFDCLVLHCFIKTRLIYNSVLETKEVQRLTMKVSSIYVFAFLSVLLYL